MSAIETLVQGAQEVTTGGLSRGTAGNISVRDDDVILISASGTDMAALGSEGVSRVGLETSEVQGPRPSKEVPFHRAFYRRDKEFRAVVHVHSAAAMAASCLTPWRSWSAIPPISPYFIMKVGQTPLIPYADPGDPAQADAIEHLDLPFRAVLLQNHGLVAAGRSMSEAVDTAMELEAACDLTLRLHGSDPHLLDDEAIRRLAEKSRSSWFGPGTAAATREA